MLKFKNIYFQEDSSFSQFFNDYLISTFKKNYYLYKHLLILFCSHIVFNDNHVLL